MAINLSALFLILLLLAAGIYAAPPANDACANATPIAAGSFAFNTNEATKDAYGGCVTSVDTAPDVWFVHVPLLSGSMTVSTCNTANFDTKIWIYQGSCGGTCLTGLDDTSGCGVTTRLSIGVTAGTTYYIRVGGYSANKGSGTVLVDSPQPACTSSTCLNGGVCDAANGCSCPNGWYGKTCNINACTSPTGYASTLCDTFSAPVSGWSSNTHSPITNAVVTCGNWGRVVGPNRLTNGYIQRAVTGLAAGEYKINFDYLFIDSWDGEMATFKINGATFWSAGFTQNGGNNECGPNSGAAYWADTLRAVSVTYTHAGGNVVFEWRSGVDQDASDESFGLASFSIHRSGACASNPCLNGGTCFLNTCTCATGWTGSVCETPTCATNPCQNGASCSVGGSTHVCSCTAGWSGQYCTAPSCTTNVCQNGGSCSISGQSFVCTCTAGWGGTNCNVPTCTTGYCANGGSCSLVNNVPTCACTNGFTAARCDTATCSTNPCANGGVCSVNNNVHTCSACTAGWGGQYCTQPSCSPSPCQNGATCSVSGQVYVCACGAGWGGTNCNVPTCTTGYCANGGSCSLVNNVPTCACTAGWTAARCGTATCTPNPCLNGGSCSVVSNQPTCSCVNGWVGAYCQTDTAACPVISGFSLATCDTFNNGLPVGYTSNADLNGAIVQCGSFGYVLGAQRFGQGIWLNKVFPAQPAGQYRIRFTFYYMDSWDNHGASATINGQSVWSGSADMNSEGGSYPSQCGASWHWAAIYFGDKPQIVEIPYTLSTAGDINIRWTTGLDQAGDDESFAVNNIGLYRQGSGQHQKLKPLAAEEKGVHSTSSRSSKAESRSVFGSSVSRNSAVAAAGFVVVLVAVVAMKILLTNKNNSVSSSSQITDDVDDYENGTHGEVQIDNANEQQTIENDTQWV